ncbi:AraC family transcriptional regulator [Chitinispirillum alkaliphilum]|nr:AraC family transcriptional regulator [Chitinispirillum alkaliphilum]
MKKKGLLYSGILLAIISLALEVPFVLRKAVLDADHLLSRTVSFSDSSSFMKEPGQSTVTILQGTGEELRFSFILTPHYKWYFAGILYRADTPLDLTRYTHASITIDACSTYAMQMVLLTDEPGVSDPDSPESWRHMEHLFRSQPGMTRYVMYLDHFHTPPWWINEHVDNGSSIIANPLGSVKGVKVESSPGEKINREHTIRIREIRFYRPVPVFIRVIQSALVVFSVLLFIFRFGFIKREVQDLYTPINLGNRFDNDLKTITEYIGTHYKDPSLSLGTVANFCAMHEDKVGALIKRGYGLSFKRYLNRLRLFEAQRLLRTTDRSIQEIASAVGYSNISHFNRVFKETFNGTPRQFRNK